MGRGVEVPTAIPTRSSFPALAVGAALFLITAAVNLEVPLYPTYASAAGFGSGLTAVAFAAYVAGLLPILILLGGISDRVGRVPVVVVGLIGASAATTVMILWPEMPTLFAARILQGIGVGLSVAAGTAYIAERLGAPDGPERAARVAAVTTSIGFGSGALATSIALLWGETLRPGSFWVMLLPTLCCIAVVVRLPRAETSPGAPLLRLPYFPRGTLPYSMAIGVAWAVTGLVIAVVPKELARHALAPWSGLALFLVNGSGALVQPLARRMAPDRAMRIGFVLLPVGYTVLVLGAWQGALIVALAGASVAGMACYGFTYLGGLSAVSRASGADRARGVSGYFLFAYLGFGIPSIAIGFLADRFGIVPALAGFGVVALIADLSLLRRMRHDAARWGDGVGSDRDPRRTEGGAETVRREE